MPATLSPSPPLELNSPDLIRRVNDLRTIDNHTNWLYMVREWLILGGIIAYKDGLSPTRAQNTVATVAGQRDKRCHPIRRRLLLLDAHRAEPCIGTTVFSSAFCFSNGGEFANLLHASASR